MKDKEQKYMNVETGSVDSRDGWDYEDSEGFTQNAVDLGEVVPVFWDSENETWTGVFCDCVINKTGRVINGSP